MSGLVIAGDTSGSVTLQAPAVAGSTTINLPSVSGGSFVVSDSSGNVGIGTSSPAAKLDINGGLNFTGTGNRITGDFSNATIANRVMFQTNTTNGNTFTGIIPNGTSTTAGVVCYANSDPTNTSTVSLAVLSSEARLNSSITGTGTYLPMTFYTNGSERMRIDTSGNLLFNSGYGSVATAYGCRAWVNFNGSGTVAIRQSGNVSSITDVNTGRYTVNFETALPDANYAALVERDSTVTIPNDSNDTRVHTLTSSGFGVTCWTNSLDSYPDPTTVCIAVFR